MIELNLQYFGGRGSAGARGGASGGGAKQVEITDNDWMDWAADPEPFQAALNGEKMPNVSQADGHTYTKEEKKRMKEVAQEMQLQAESSIVSENTLFRGESYNSLAEAKAKYKVGKSITNDKLTSYATESDIATMYAGASMDFAGSKAVKVVITNTNVSNKVGGSVGIHTDPFAIGGSAEVVTPKGLKSKVVGSSYDKESNTLFVRMENSATPKKRSKR